MRYGLLLTFLLIAAAAPARAGLLGSTVNLSTYYPDESSLFLDPGDAVVSAAVEYPMGSYTGYSTSWEADISDGQLTITDAGNNGLPFASAAFNGWILKVVSGPAIVSASVDPSSGFAPVLSIVGGNLLLNYQGVSGATGTTSVIDFTTAVPEPAAPVLLAAGLLGLGIARRRGRRA